MNFDLVCFLGGVEFDWPNEFCGIGCESEMIDGDMFLNVVL